MGIMCEMRCAQGGWMDGDGDSLLACLTPTPNTTVAAIVLIAMNVIHITASIFGCRVTPDHHG